LYSFGTAPDGYQPQGGLILSGNTLYGTTYDGGTNLYYGTIFKINTDGSGYAILHSFTNTPDGELPQNELVLSGNMLYGATTYGGTNGFGMIFAIDTTGNNYSVLHSFAGAPEPSYPVGGLVLNAGMLYGTGSSGGTNTAGGIFAISTNGSGFRNLYDFSAYVSSTNTDGKVPEASLTFSGGYLYGTTKSGGGAAGGTLFLINTNGTGFTVLNAFVDNADSGWAPTASPIRVGNSLWGTTAQGGASTYGTLYRLPLPAITEQPQSATVTNTSPASFSVTAADDQPIRYQWYFNTNTLLAGQTTNILTLASATNGNKGTYTVVVSDSLASVTSSPAVLLVIVPGVKPAITQNPQNVTVVSGSPASFTNTATGTEPLSYTWYYNTNTPVSSGQDETVYTIPSASSGDGGYYSVIVTNLYGSATSTAALLTVNSGTKPTITQPPQNFTVTNGLTATFTNIASGTAPLFYEWYFNTNTPKGSGTDDTVLTVSSVTTNDAGYYQAIVTNLYGSVTSTPALLTVIVPTSKPVITQQPQNYSVTNGYNATFTNVASGTAPLYYQWYFNANMAIVGGTNAILAVTFVTTNQAGYYTVVASNIAGSTTSSPALLTVIGTRPIIFVQPQSTTTNNGNPFSFTVTAAGQPPLGYQWYTNLVLGAYAQRGQTNSIYTNASASDSIQGYYLVVITNSLGKATSSPALLTVLTKPVMMLQPQSVVVTNGNPVTFTSSAMGAGLLSFQWYFRTNTAVAGATNTSLTFTNASTGLAGAYAVRVSNTFGAVTSSYALLIVSNGINFLSFNLNPANGSASFAVANAVGSANRLWATTNLAVPADWRVIASDTMGASGLWFYTDTNSATTNAALFYRFSSP
jgi:uncharacterized repeat protein (TIGR03803 family)